MKFAYLLLFLITVAAPSKAFWKCAFFVSENPLETTYVAQLDRYVTARRFAKKFHYKQVHGYFEWAEHLLLIEDILRAYGFGYLSRHDLKLRTILKLHDMLEDTGVTEAYLSARFTRDEMETLRRLTFPPGLGEAQRGQFLRLKMAEGDEMAILAKLVDRTANVESSVIDYFDNRETKFLSRYVYEWLFFADVIVPKDPRGKLIWNHLNSLLTDSIYRRNFYLNPDPRRRNPLFPRRHSRYEDRLRQVQLSRLGGF